MQKRSTSPCRVPSLAHRKLLNKSPSVSLAIKRFVKRVSIFSGKLCVQSDTPHSSFDEILLCNCNQRATNSAAAHRPQYHQGSNSPGEIVMLDAWISQCADHPAHFAVNNRRKC